MKSIGVVGCGPKAVALAAKIATLHSVKHLFGDTFEVPSLTIFEVKEVGSNWSGKFSFTDGKALLCTDIHRDIGFPYGDLLGAPVNNFMMGNFSWTSFLTSGQANLNYNEWISMGCPQPDHAMFRSYINWVLLKSEKLCKSISVFRNTEVLSFDSDKRNAWRLTSINRRKNKKAHHQFDAIVMTGTKPRHARDKLCKEHIRHLDGTSFWKNTEWIKLKRFLNLNTKNYETVSVAIVGNGGTAAAIAARLVKLGNEGVEITFIGSSPFLDSRPKNYFADVHYGDLTSWSEMSLDTKNNFLQRSNRGRVWDNIIDEIKQFKQISYQVGKAKSAKIVAITDRARPNEKYEFFKIYRPERGKRKKPITADVLIDARGFDDLWFLEIAGPNFRKLFQNGVKARRKDFQELIRNDGLKSDLSLKSTKKYPNIPSSFHIPMLGALEHPASPNLMALGGVADSILSPYLV